MARLWFRLGSITICNRVAELIREEERGITSFFLFCCTMSRYKEITSLVLIVLGLLASWVALAVCQTGTSVQYFSAFVALGYWGLAFLSWPERKRES